MTPLFPVEASLKEAKMVFISVMPSFKSFIFRLIPLISDLLDSEVILMASKPVFKLEMSFFTLEKEFLTFSLKELSSSAILVGILGVLELYKSYLLITVVYC